MRFHLLGLVLMAGVAAPAIAQDSGRVERRVDRLEQEMRAVQRLIFPAANGPTVGPEIQEQVRSPEPQGVASGTAVSDLTARVDALESQLAQLTGQVEQNGNRLRQLETAFATLRESTGSRLEALEKPAATAPQAARDEDPAPAAASSRPAAQASGAVVLGNDAEAAYNAGFRLWEQKKYKEAQKLLEAVAKKWPEHRFASWSANLAGRAYLDDGNPTAAARVLFANYESNPKGERAADSLFFLGQALFALKKPAEACKAYDELQDVYGAAIRDYLKDRLPAARAAAKCK